MAQAAFLDEAAIEVAGGRGGDGSASFRRTKREPRGGPDGGNGGRGGNVHATTDIAMNSLYDYVAKKRFAAGSGGRGGSNKKHGANGEDLLVALPIGTDVYDIETGSLHASLLDQEERVLLAAGGLGGRGNVTFKSSTNRTPRQFTKGQPGDIRQFRLVLRLFADVGLIGLPNAGKSSLLNALANTEVATADYPFTTMKPQLGVVELEDYSRFTVADLPGIIQGAAMGVGLGLRFLRHASRTRMLLHLVDTSNGDVGKIMAQRDELMGEMHDMADEVLLAKPRALVLTKIDLLDDGSQVKRMLQQVRDKVTDTAVLAISSLAGTGIDELVQAVSQQLAMQES